MVAPIGQLVQLWDQLTGARPLDLDDEGRVHLDAWELDPAVQHAVAERWGTATSDTITELADLDWFSDEVRRLRLLRPRHRLHRRRRDRRPLAHALNRAAPA
ncbi:hypothetical protein STANM309S_06450 [Streptomyces tanashiensis]